MNKAIIRSSGRRAFTCQEKKKKKLCSAILLACSIALGGQMFTASHASAQDVWVCSVANSSYERGYEVFIMTETIQSDGSTWAKATTKKVRNGQLLKTIRWTFDGVTGMWRYETSTMDGTHTTRVIEGSMPDKILRYCLAHSR